jgi:hypothetical protein
MFAFLGLTLGCYILYFSYNLYLINKNLNEAIQICLKKLLSLFLTALPCLIFSFLFFIKIKFPDSNNAYPFKELIKWINDARPFIVYDYVDEEIITEQYFHILLILLVLSFILKGNNKKFETQITLEKANINLIPVIFAFILLFVTPNEANAGMMSDRYCLLFYMFFLIWVVSRSINIKFNNILILIILLLHIGMLFKHTYGTIRKIDKDAITIKSAEKYISENSIVLPVNLSDNWLELHFSNYLGVEKSMIILENYEASVGWFPVKWNMDKMPNILLGDRNTISGVNWISNTNSKVNKEIDYVLLYGNLNKLDNPEWNELKVQLQKNFKLKYESENHYIKLFEKNKNI